MRATNRHRGLLKGHLLSTHLLRATKFTSHFGAVLPIAASGLRRARQLALSFSPPCRARQLCHQFQSAAPREVALPSASVRRADDATSRPLSPQPAPSHTDTQISSVPYKTPWNFHRERTILYVNFACRQVLALCCATCRRRRRCCQYRRHRPFQPVMLKS